MINHWRNTPMMRFLYRHIVVFNLFHFLVIYSNSNLIRNDRENNKKYYNHIISSNNNMITSYYDNCRLSSVEMNVLKNFYYNNNGPNW